MSRIAAVSLALFAFAFISLADARAERDFYRIYQPTISADGTITASGTWRKIPSAQSESPKTWVAPFSETGSQLMPRCQLTKDAGLTVSSVLGNFNPRITIHVAQTHSLKKSIDRATILQTMIECIQLNLKSGSFFTIRIKMEDGVAHGRFAEYEGSYATLKT